MLLEDSIGRTSIAKVPQPALYLQCRIFLSDTAHTVLDDDTFRVVQIEGREKISEPFEFTLTLRGNSKGVGHDPIIFRDLLGQQVSFAVCAAVRLQDAAGQLNDALAGRGGAGDLALFNGMAAAFAMAEPGLYKLTVRPALWKLSLANRYRIHKQKNLREAIKEVCSLHGVKVAFRNLDDAGSYNLATARTQDWLQAGETDLQFIHRLMRKAHLYYYFEHSGTDHTVVFANDREHPPIAQGSLLRYTHTTADNLGLHRSDTLLQYEYEQTLTQSGVGGAFTRQEEAWAQDEVAKIHTIFKPVGSATVEPSFSLHKVYQYGVNDQLANDYTRTTADALEAAGSRLTGASRCQHLRPGYKFQVAQVPDEEPYPIRPTLNQSWFVVQESRHQASLDGEYRNEFVALSADSPLAEVSVQDTQQGVILATVVGKGAATAPGDWRYYSKTNFDPVESSAKDISSDPAVTKLQGVYVRLASDPEGASPVWVKLAAHMLSAPEIGAMVLVSRSNDESELPEAQNLVEAPGQMAVPSGRWLPETRVANNYSTAFGDSKSIRCGKSSSMVLQTAINKVESQYATGKFRDVSYSQGGHFSFDTAESGAAGTLSDTYSVGSTYSHSEGAERINHDEVGHRRVEEITGNSESISAVSGTSLNQSTVALSQVQSLTGAANHTSITGAHQELSVVAASNSINTVGVSSRVTVTGAASEVSVYGALHRAEVLGEHLLTKLESPASAEAANSGITINLAMMMVIL